ncbi:hypothetical protein ACFV1F_40515 [Streptomyces sp. NPDC059590]|uniref:hypothetical protein n=1 Tax=unclassified Streptomyces TaxID=2593676 RepID=UPI003690271C
MRVPRDRAPHAPGGGGRVLVVGSVNLGLGRTPPRLPRGGRGAHQALAARRPCADVTLLGSGGVVVPVQGGLAVHPTA